MTHTSSVAQAPLSATVVIRPSRGLAPIRYREMWEFRELFLFLVWRDIKVRYAQTVLGAAWTVFQPLAMMAVYTYAFTRVGRLSTGSIPYPLFALSGLVVWVFVARATVTGAQSLLTDLQVVTKTAAPRMLIPLASVASVVIDFLISLGLFIVFAAFYGRLPSVRALAVVPLLLALIGLTYGLGLLLSSLNVKYRDVGQALPFLVQIWFFLSPIAYTLHTPGLSWETIVQALNPLVGIVEATRWALLNGPAPHGLLLVSIVEIVVLLGVALVYFSRVERTLADDA